MATFTTNAVGDVDDVVRLRLAGDNVVVCESYQVHVGVLSQPAAFTLRMGKGDTLAPLLQKYPPRTTFGLFIGDAPGVQQFSGFTDGYEADGETGATEATFSGRDYSGEMHVGEFKGVQSFNNYTYEQLGSKVIAMSGVVNPTTFTSNGATRNIRAGVGVVTIGPEPTPDDDVIGDPDGATGAPNTVIRTKPNEKMYRFLRRHYDRAGIMLWAAPQPGSFVIGVPNGNQQPLYQFLRRRGLPSNQVNILRAKHRFNTVGRFTTCEVHSRSGGRLAGRAKFSGAYVDDEMFNLGYVNPDGTSSRFHSYRDANVTSPEQAETYARRKAAEARRASWSLTYTIAGHTCPALTGNVGERAVITPDTVAAVIDDELGITGNFYVEDVIYNRSGGGTTTDVRLMRISDLIFGNEED